MNKIKCFFGFHNWNQSRSIVAMDAFPPSFVKYVPPLRECRECGKKQRWLPGYGGSELGCWITRSNHE